MKLENNEGQIKSEYSRCSQEERSENRMAEEGKLKEVDTKKEKDVEDGKQ